MCAPSLKIMIVSEGMLKHISCKYFKLGRKVIHVTSSILEKEKKISS